MSNSSLRSFSVVALIAFSGACSSGGGSAPQQMVSAAAFAGGWDFRITTTSTNCPGGNVGDQSALLTTIAVNGQEVRLTDATDGDLVGIARDNMVSLTRDNGALVVDLTMTASDTLTGVATQTEPGGCVRVDSVVGSRTSGGGGGGNALALEAGAWSFDLEVGGVPLLTFPAGVLTQNGPAVSFAWEDPTLGQLFSSTWTGDLSGADWAPSVAGDVTDLVITGAFAADGRSFDGTFTSPAGNGTITGSVDNGGNGGGAVGGNALALEVGGWDFEMSLPTGPLSPALTGGMLTQNGADVRFEWSNGPSSVDLDGALTGAGWSPGALVSGFPSFSVTGDFAQDGRSFTGTFQSLFLGDGTITGQKN